MFAIQNIKTGKFLYGTDYRYRPPHQRTSKTKCSLTALSQKPHTTFGLRGSAAKITESLC